MMTRYGFYARLPERMHPVEQDRHHVSIEKQDVHPRPGWAAGL